MSARDEWLKTKAQFTTILDAEEGERVDAVAKILKERKKIKDASRYQVTRYALLQLVEQNGVKTVIKGPGNV